jgi:hypothetical protein
VEQRVNIKFCAKLRKTATETHEMLVLVYGTEAVSRKSVYDRFKRFRDGKETTEGVPRSGWTCDSGSAIIPKRAFADSFQQLYELCQKCVVLNGDYFGDE